MYEACLASLFIRCKYTFFYKKNKNLYVFLKYSSLFNYKGKYSNNGEPHFTNYQHGEFKDYLKVAH